MNFLFLAATVAWFGTLAGMMIQGIEPGDTHFAYSILVLPSLLLGLGNFHPVLTRNLVFARKSGTFVALVGAFAIATIVFWRSGFVAENFPLACSGTLLQALLLRLLVRQHFQATGVYPGFISVGRFHSDAAQFPTRNRVYAGLLVLLGLINWLALSVL